MSEQESLPPQTPYEILGDQGIKALVKAFYEVMDTHPAAKEIRAMHAENLEPVKSKLVSFLVGWMGGPPVYLAVTGTVCLTDPTRSFPHRTTSNRAVAALHGRGIDQGKCITGA